MEQNGFAVLLRRGAAMWCIVCTIVWLFEDLNPFKGIAPFKNIGPVTFFGGEKLSLLNALEELAFITAITIALSVIFFIAKMLIKQR